MFMYTYTHALYISSLALVQVVNPFNSCCLVSITYIYKWFSDVPEMSAAAVSYSRQLSRTIVTVHRTHILSDVHIVISDITN